MANGSPQYLPCEDFLIRAGFHWNVANVLKAIGGSFQLEYVAEDFPIDIVIVEDKIAIEVRSWEEICKLHHSSTR